MHVTQPQRTLTDLSAPPQRCGQSEILASNHSGRTNRRCGFAPHWTTGQPLRVGDEGIVAHRR